MVNIQEHNSQPDCAHSRQMPSERQNEIPPGSCNAEQVSFWGWRLSQIRERSLTNGVEPVFGSLVPFQQNLARRFHYFSSNNFLSARLA